MSDATIAAGSKRQSFYERQIMVLKLPDCPRCGQTHDNIRVYAFVRPPKKVISVGGEEFNGWAICPETCEPILVPAMRHLPASVEEYCFKDCIGHYLLFDTTDIAHRRKSYVIIDPLLPDSLYDI